MKLKRLLSPKTARSCAELERRDELVEANGRPADRPQRILVPGRGNAYSSLLFTHNDCRAGRVFGMECTSAERHILQAGTTNELREACKTAEQHS